MNSIEINKQEEYFVSNKNIINNLDPNEEILFQLKTSEISLATYYEYHLYVTNKKMCIIKYPNKAGQEIYFLNLEDLQGISFRKRKYTEIEFISEKIYTHVSEHSDTKRHSCFFIVRNNLSYLIKIIESIFWHYSNVNDRLDKLRNIEHVQIPNEFSNFLKNDKVFIQQKKSSEAIEFNQNLYLTYSTNNFRPNTSFGKIIFKPSFDSKIKIKCKYFNDSLKELEIIYLLMLFWKFKNNSLLAKQELLDIKKKLKPKEELLNSNDIFKEQFIIKTCYKCGAILRSPYESCALCGVKQNSFSEKEKKLLNLRKELLKCERKRYFDCTLEGSDRSELSEKLYNHFENYLNKDEKILIYYKEKLFNKLSLLFIFLALIDIISFFLMINLSFIFFLFFLFFIPGLIFLPIAFTCSLRSCLFTSQKIIFRKLRKIGTTQYKNISSITNVNNKKSENIFFHLNQPIDSNTYKNKTSYALNFVPKELNLYEKIIKLRNQFKN